MGVYQRLKTKYRRFKLGLGPQRTLFYGFLTYILAGFLILSLPFLQKNPIGWIDNLFTATSAVSTTGLLTVPLTASYNFIGQFVIMLLFQLGGIGYLTFTTFIILSTTRKMSHWHQLILKTEFTLPNTLKIRDFLKSVILFTLIMEFIGAALFFIAFRMEGFDLSEALWQSIFHSVSAFCTAGFSLGADGFVPYMDNGFINTITSILAISGSLGFIVVTDFYIFFTKKAHKLSFTTKIVAYGFLILLTIGTVYLFFGESRLYELSYYNRFLASFFQTMSAMTTVGFNTVDIGMFSQAALLITILLMYIGASPSGTAGGIKITTLTAILAILKTSLRGKKTVTFLGTAIPTERLQIAVASFIFYSILIVIGSFLVTLSNDFNFENILFEVASALGTVGLSTGITGDLNAMGKIVLIILMFIGRLGVLTFGLAIWSRKIKSPITTQEEDLAI